MADLLAQLDRAELAPVYLLVSAEPLLLERAVAAIRDRAVPESARGFNHDVVDGKGLAGDRLLGLARTLPMMAERRMVLVRGIDQVAAAELAELIPYLSDPNPSTVLVGVAAKVDKRIKFFQTAKKKGFLHELAAPRNPTPWLREEAKRRGVRIEPAACARLADVVGSDLARLEVALEQLGLYAGERPVTVDDVDDLIADTRERTVFELTDAIGVGDPERALAAVARLFDQRQSPIGVVVMLARHMRQLGLLHAGREQNLSKGEVARLVGAPPFVVDKLASQARRYAPAAVERALVLLSEADGALKGMAPMTKTLGRGLGERVVVDRLVSRLIGLGR